MLLATYQHRFEHQQPTSINKDALPCDLPSFLTDQKTHGISKVLGLLQTSNQQDPRLQFRISDPRSPVASLRRLALERTV